MTRRTIWVGGEVLSWIALYAAAFSITYLVSSRILQDMWERSAS